jgi:hypothetical protein
MKKYFVAFVLTGFVVLTASAQHDHSTHKIDTSKRKTAAPAQKVPTVKPAQDHSNHAHKTHANPPADTIIKPGNKSKTHDHSKHENKTQPTDSIKTREDHSAHDHRGSSHDKTNMTHAFSLHLPMTRNGSGTGWLPDASPMYGTMFHSKKWMYMLHGNLFLRYTNQDFTKKGSRGGEAFDAPNWIMGMGQRKVGDKGLFHFSTMLSLDPLTEGGDGYPLLFQSGETYKGAPLVDRQHPHDFFSELAVSYAFAFSKKTDMFLYLGYPGEPAIGPVAFMHRPSALYNPDAPLSHHWVDATHITFGVATLGIRAGKFKLEGSSFTGREPDEDRYNFDKPRFDSWSSRLSFNPNKNWALQVSQAFLESPEPLHADEDVNRTTASATYSYPMGKDGSLNAVAVWGMNKVKGHDGENAFLLEGSWRKNRLAVHGRYELVQKSEELNLEEIEYGHDAIFPVNAFTVGLNYDILKMGKTRLALGGQYTFYKADSRLNSLYGKTPMAMQFFVRLYPGMMRM